VLDVDALTYFAMQYLENVSSKMAVLRLFWVYIIIIIIIIIIIVIIIL